jgi:hypothetical protein
MQPFGDGDEGAELAQIQIVRGRSRLIWLFCSVDARTVSISTKAALDGATSNRHTRLRERTPERNTSLARRE